MPGVGSPEVDELAVVPNESAEGSAQEQALGAGAAAQSADWAEFNRKNRVGAKDFAYSRPLAHIIILKVCHDPLLQHVLSPLLHLASDKWDLENLSGVLKEGKQYRFRLLELARDCGLDGFFDGIRDRLRDRSKWLALPHATRSTAMSTLAFRLLSRIAGQLVISTGG